MIINYSNNQTCLNSDSPLTFTPMSWNCQTLGSVEDEQ